MLPKHKQGAPAPEKVLTFLLFQCSVLKWWWWWRKKFSDGGLVVFLWSWCGALLTIGVVRYSQRHQNGSRFWDNGGKSDFYSCTPLFTLLHTLYTFTTYTPFNIKGMYTLSPPVDSNAPPLPPLILALKCAPPILWETFLRSIACSMFGVFLLIFCQNLVLHPSHVWRSCLRQCENIVF